MAIFHMHGQMIKRSEGRSAVACAAYRAGEAIYDELRAKLFDFTGKQDVEESLIMGPPGMPNWMRRRAALWNAVEAAERSNGQPAREFDLALPIELVRANRTAARELVTEWAYDMFVIHGLIVDIAFHDMKGRNPHAHVMITTRPLRPHACEFQEGSSRVFGKKARHLNDRAYMNVWRWNWACTINEALELHGIDARVDHRSLADQGITDRLPGLHVGPKANAMWLQRGIDSDRWEENKIIWWCNEREWFEENDRYVQFLDEEAAKERALDAQAQSDLAKRDEFDDLLGRLEAARAASLFSRRKLLNAASDRCRTATKSLMAGRAAEIGKVSAGLEHGLAVALRPAIVAPTLLGLRLSRSTADIGKGAQDRLDASALALTAAGGQSKHQYHRLGEWSERLNSIGAKLVTHERRRLAGERERLSSLTQRLDGLVTVARGSKALRVSNLALRLEALPYCIRQLQARSQDLAERASPGRFWATNIERSSRVEAHAKRMTHAVSCILKKNEQRLDHLAGRLEERRPSIVAAAVEGARTRARSFASFVVGLASEGAEHTLQLVASAADNFAASVHRGSAWIVATSTITDTKGRARTLHSTSTQDEEEEEQAREDASSAELEEKAPLEHAVSLLQFEARKGYLPVRRDNDGLFLDIEALPKHLASVASYADHPRVLELLEADEVKRWEELLGLLMYSKNPLISRDGSGQLVANVEFFPSQLRSCAAAMISSDRMLLDHAEALVERQSAPDQANEPWPSAVKILAQSPGRQSYRTASATDAHEVTHAFFKKTKQKGKW